MKKQLLISMVGALFLGSCQNAHNIQYSLVDSPSTQNSNHYYISNKSPLTPQPLLKLPIGNIDPKGWLREYLLKQSHGLCGHLDEISAWLQKDDNAWLSKEGKGKWGWEEVPYWLKGYGDMAYILDNKKQIAHAKEWIEGVLKSQREDGNFGPIRTFDDDHSQDLWGNMLMLYCLQSWYEYSQDARVLDFMTRYFQYQASIPDQLFLTHYWQHLRGGDNLYSVLWLYNRTQKPELLKLAQKIHRCTADWSKRDYTIDEIKGWKEKRDNADWSEFRYLPDWHNVNIAQSFREPAQYYQLSHDSTDLESSYFNFDIVRKEFGQVPGGMFGGDENCRPGYSDPRQGIETCGMVEQMNSDEHLLRITGDISWADHTEEVAFNSYPAALTEDMRSLRYITSPNMIVSDDKNHRPDIQNNGPFLMMNPFSSRCCQHNHGQGWPYFAEHLWMATPDNGLAATLYSASHVKAYVGDVKQQINIQCDTHYPFEDSLRFTINSATDIQFPLYLRVPKWSKKASLSINNSSIEIPNASKKYIKIERQWHNGDKICLVLSKQIEVKQWSQNKNSVSVYYGPLAYSLKIDEQYQKGESDKTAIFDSQWQKGVNTSLWPSYQIFPKSSWNYGITKDAIDHMNFVVKQHPWPKNNNPFNTTNVPISIETLGCKIPSWGYSSTHIVGELPQSPLTTTEPVENIKLIPMGAARLRISSFPVIQ